jgi:hypothetical protein
MTEQQKASLQTIWENLNAIRYDIEQGDPQDALVAIEECYSILNDMGIGDEK